MTIFSTTRLTQSYFPSYQLEADKLLREEEEGAVELDYRFRPYDYIVDKLGWTPWSGSEEQPGQAQLLEAYALALRQLHEKDAFEKEEIAEEDLQYWTPGEVIQNRLLVEAGHTTGKTKISAGILSHFFDNFEPAIIYSFAPSHDQINDLLWKEVRVDRRDKPLPGRVLDRPELKYKANHFAKGKATNNANNAGTERAQGQHGEYLMFILDEAEGIAQFVWDAVDSMASGGIAIVLMLANPKTRTSQFHKQKSSKFVKSFRISCLWHPNVLNGREIVPGAVRRDYVEVMLEKHATLVGEHNEDDLTFTVPWRAGEIYKPDPEFMFRVMGVAPKSTATNTFVPVGRYESAKAREAPVEPVNFASLGLDVARFGDDMGSFWVRTRGRLFRYAQVAQLDSHGYRDIVKEAALKLHAQGVRHISIRIDGTGGYGGGTVDLLKKDESLRRKFITYTIHEVQFGSSAHDQTAYADIVTEMYAEAAETLKGLRIDDPPNELEADLCERTYTYVNLKGKDVKKLEKKEDFKKRVNHSPDDGDGLVLAAAPEFIFEGVVEKAATIRPKVFKREQLPF